MIGSVLGGAGRIAGPLGYTQYRASASWWLLGGVSAVNAIAVYQAKGAADIAASYVNLANPGTYNAAPGTAPTFNAATGWTFNGIDQYLTTGVTPASGWSAIVRFSGVAAVSRYIFGANGTAKYFMISADIASSYVRYQSGTAVGVNASIAPPMTAGVLAIAGEFGYRNGAQDATGMAAAYTDAAAIYIGGRNANGTASSFFSGAIQAFAVYNTTLSAPAVAAISAAMAAL